MRGWWSDYRCLNQQTPSRRKSITLFGLNAGYCATPFYEAFLALEMALSATGYSNVKSVWIPRNCPTGIGGLDCQASGTNCSIHNYGVAADIDPYGHGNDYFYSSFGAVPKTASGATRSGWSRGWDFRDCKLTEPQVRAVEAIRNTQGEPMFRWLGWPIGDTMHFEGQVPPSRTKVNWNTVAGYSQGGNMAENHPPKNHTDFVNAHKITEEPSWISVWDSYPYTSVKESWAWPANRLDIAYFHEKAILPLVTRISELETDVGALIAVNTQQSAAIATLSKRLADLEARPPVTGGGTVGTLPPGTILQLETQAKVL